MFDHDGTDVYGAGGGEIGGDGGAVWPVEPSAELVRCWERADARYGEPDFVAGVGAVPAGQPGDFDLVEQVAAFERVISWARARQLVAVQALAGRPSMNPCWPVPVGVANIAAEEVAARLGSSRVVGRELVEAARLFDGPLFPTAAALERGEIDWGKARVVIAALRRTSGPIVVDVQDRVLPGAGRRTHAQLRADLQRALIEVDPVDADLRTVRAVDERRVCRPKVLPDGMAGIWAVLPAGVAAAIDTELTGRAHLGKRSGDPRTVDQLRADTFADSLLRDHQPPAGPSAGVGASAGAGRGPGAGAGRGAAFGLAGAAGTGSPAGCGPDLAAPEQAAVRVGRGRAQINVSVALTTLLGLDERPGDLAGYGAITAQTARRLATAGTWRRLVTDPLSGAVLDVGRRRYHPPDDLADIVRARDQHCLSPICRAAARDCDLDHREPFRPDGTGGATSADNLGPLCRRDHLLKTHGGWNLDKDATNTFTWTTPTGHTYPYRSPAQPGHREPAEPDGDQPPPF